jgi:23S rRNA (cytosine1962-C5)-methyltransferase
VRPAVRCRALLFAVRDDGRVDDDYDLIDAGDGARLERFGSLLVDRPAPGALAARRSPDRWAAADLRFDRRSGWTGPALADAERGWSIQLGDTQLELRPTAAGQLGVYPEHALHLPWLLAQVAERVAGGEAVEVLHLFAATGLATLAMAAADAAVTHVDAARPTVAWARRNAERNDLADRPIRWIVDDALGFAERERRRGRRYTGIVLDPPSYGHGARGASTTWSLERDLLTLLGVCATLLTESGFVLLTTHTEGVSGDDLADVLDDAVARPGTTSAAEVELEAASGAVLSLGAVATWDGRG